MKRLSTLSLLVVILATSCQTSSDLGSTSLIQKRRYTKGFNLNMKKPTVTKSDETHKEESVGVARAEDEMSTAAVKVDYPSTELKSEKENQSDLAAIELSESLMKDIKKKDAENTEIPSANPTPLNEAYPLTLENKSKSNLDYAAASSMAASGEATILVIILTILLPPLGVALVFGLGTEFWISLLLTLLFYLPGLIYSLIIIL